MEIGTRVLWRNNCKGTVAVVRPGEVLVVFDLPNPTFHDNDEKGPRKRCWWITPEELTKLDDPLAIGTEAILVRDSCGILMEADSNLCVVKSGPEYKKDGVTCFVEFVNREDNSLYFVETSCLERLSMQSTVEPAFKIWCVKCRKAFPIYMKYCGACIRGLVDKERAKP